MNISVKSEYALKAVFDLAVQYLNLPPGSPAMPPVKIADIAGRQKIPQKFLELILVGSEAGRLCRIAARRRRWIPVGASAGIDHRRRSAAVQSKNVQGRAARSARSPTRLAEFGGESTAPISDIIDQTGLCRHVARSWTEKQTQYIPNWEI